jgi:hypothetical protein
VSHRLPATGLTGEADVHLGALAVEGLDEPVPFWMSLSQYEYWKHTHLTVDVVRGRGSGFSVEAPEGVRFLIRSRLLTDDELAAFGISAPGLRPVVPRGPGSGPTAPGSRRRSRSP